MFRLSAFLRSFRSRLCRARWGLVPAVAVFLLTLGWTFAPPTPYFVRPAGWPKPKYDFAKNPQTEAGFQLGRRLFYDPILSRDNSTSCASCHLQATGFTHVDHSVSHGIEGRKGTRNTLALVNLAWVPALHWDGGVNNLEVQPVNPITHPAEMDFTLAGAVGKLNQSGAYRQRFRAAFGDSVVTGQRVLKALAQFTVALESFNSKYDRYVRREPGGDFTPQEINGLKLFRQSCASCHPEPLFTNHGFANNGLAPDSVYRDLGRFRITGAPADSFKFRVPTLRNIEFTYPYMHDGRFRKLKDVLSHYTDGLHQSTTLAPQLRKPLVLTADEKKDLIAFLLTLTDREFLFDKRFGYAAQ